MSTHGTARRRTASRKITPPSAAYMSNDQFASYLADLRSHRVARPGGARPLPPNSNRLSVDGSTVGSGVYRNSSGLPSPVVSDTFSAAGAAHAHQRSQSDAPAAAPAPSAHTGRQQSFSHNSLAGSVASSRYSTVSGRGRDYYAAAAAATATATPTASNKRTQPPPPLRPDEVVPTDTYMESGQRWMEKEEAVSLRQALEDMDLRLPGKRHTANAAADDERLYQAALSEAAALVWQHQHGGSGGNTQAPLPAAPGAPYAYKSHLRKNSYAYARTASVGRYGDDIAPSGLARDAVSRSVSGSSAGSSYGASQRVVSGGSGHTSARASYEHTRKSSEAPSVFVTPALNKTSPAATAGPSATNGSTIRAKAYTGLFGGGPRPMMSTSSSSSSAAAASNSKNHGRRRSSMKRNISGEIEKPFSGDQIYEEPETGTPDNINKKASLLLPATSSVLQDKDENPVRSTGAGTGSNNNGAGSSDTTDVAKLVSRYEIHRNAPSQSRNPQYTTNAVAPKIEAAAGLNADANTTSSSPSPSSLSSPSAPAPAPAPPPAVPRKNGVEIRSEDIRQATSRLRADRSPALPTPSYVSDTPGRPIVSFAADWKEAKVGEEERVKEKKEVKQTRQEQEQDQEQKEEDIEQEKQRNKAATDAQPDVVRDRSSSREEDRTQPQPQPQNQNQNQQAPPARLGPFAASLRSSSPFAARQQHQHQHQHQPPTQQQPPPFRRRRLFEPPPALPVDGARGGASDSHRPTVPTITVTEDTVSERPPVPTIAVTDESTAEPSVPTISVTDEDTSSRPPIPTIVLPEEEVVSTPAAPGMPTIVTPDDDRPQRRTTPSIPVLVTPADDPTPCPLRITTPKAPKTPITTPPSSSPARPLPTPSSSGAPVINRPRGHWSRAPAPHPAATHGTGSRGPTARCHQCRQPIVGRVVALASVGGARFHPQCFRCHACGTSLEALEILPEPEAFRAERLAEKNARSEGGSDSNSNSNRNSDSDSDTRLRFYCHLDWHERFAPRCKHCTTPIVGEHVVALGAHWHVGHFFCAECGDPFPAGATHIATPDGYAWCDPCAARRAARRAPTCRACGAGVEPGASYVRALGAAWHDACFRCAVCGDGFADGQVLPRAGTAGLMQVVCTACRARELKA
ncbi:Zinc finger, LIM-type [Niveomyces insectorum RCEF 264]|uniref:Zinc finger, LIM-type n=1 Tax=Niveomyces insectorum RCEF 264 TaxID=1081102 RepID=A0A167SHR3_9HYPO|nr:Zinc finger, LIM-type [Niveomyces insectorum RCEF 264]